MVWPPKKPVKGILAATPEVMEHIAELEQEYALDLVDVVKLDLGPLQKVLAHLESLTIEAGRVAFVMQGPQAFAVAVNAWKQVPEQWRQWAREGKRKNEIR